MEIRGRGTKGRLKKDPPPTVIGSPRFKIVSSGIYTTAAHEPAIHTRKYAERNQFCVPVDLTTKNQKQSSVDMRNQYAIIFGERDLEMRMQMKRGAYLRGGSSCGLGGSI